jgi:hypothetical protein
VKTRFIVKPLKYGRHTLYGVYDTVKGSYPAITNEFGRVQQDHTTEESAQAEADRLNRGETK